MKRDLVASQVAEFMSRYSPEIAAAIAACRSRIHLLVPRGYELVYDNYNALVFGFGPTQKSSESLLSIAAYPRWVTLFFLRGAGLEDPHRLLDGSGSQVRSIRLGSPSELDKPEIRALVASAHQPQVERFAAAPPLTTLIKSVSEKQRPRRPDAARGSAQKGG